QLCQLERHATGSGKERIEHPPGGHDDVVNAVAGAIVMALKAATHDTVSLTMPIVAGGVPRHVAGGSNLGHVNVAGAPTPPSLRPPAPTTASPDAQREAKRQAVNNDRSAYQQQGLRPAGGEPWRPFVGSGNEGFVWGGTKGRAR